MKPIDQELLVFDVDRDAMRTEYWLSTVFLALLLIVFSVYSPLLTARLVSKISLADSARLFGVMFSLYVCYIFWQGRLAIQKTILEIRKLPDGFVLNLYNKKSMSVSASIILKAPLSKAYASRRGSSDTKVNYQFMQLSEEKVCVRSDWLPEIYSFISKNS
jgi:hypothetical protein